jgi:hypothetical protein
MFHREELYEDVVNQNNVYAEQINKALEVVKRFILEKGLILTGGMAIDYALRSNGCKLYPDGTLPDYDFYSTEFHKHAYELAGILHNMKFENVQAINAQHISTMRVRVNYQVVADITYVPMAIMKQMPTITYQGFKVIHPHYQIIDQHISLSRPYDNPPLETVLSRFKKDIIRHGEITRVFPLTDKYNCQKLTPMEASRKIEIPIGMLKKQCLAGFAALAYWMDAAGALGWKHPDSKVYKYKLAGKKLSCVLPGKLSIYSDNFETYLQMLKKLLKSKYEAKYYNSIMEKTPRRVVCQDIEIFDNYGSLISAYKSKTLNCHVANLQLISVQMLTGWSLYKKQSYLRAYKLIDSIVRWASLEYVKQENQTSNYYMNFLPSASVYGSKNWSHAYISSQIKLLAFLGKIERPAATLPKPLFTEKINKETIKKLSEYDPTTIPSYQLDGDATEPFTMKKKLPTV